MEKPWRSQSRAWPVSPAALALAVGLAGWGAAALATNNPIPGVDIIVKKNPGDIVVSAPTNKDGTYQFIGLAPGKYDLSVAGRRVQTINVGANRSIRGSLTRNDDGTASVTIGDRKPVVLRGLVTVTVTDDGRDGKKRTADPTQDGGDTPGKKQNSKGIVTLVKGTAPRPGEGAGSLSGISVTGVDDKVADGNQAYRAVTPKENGPAKLPGITITGVDDPSADGNQRISVTGVDDTLPDGPQPYLAASRPGGGGTKAGTNVTGVDDSVADGAQSVAVTGVDDAAADGPQRATVAGVDDTSADGSQAYRATSPKMDRAGVPPPPGDYDGDGKKRTADPTQDGGGTPGREHNYTGTVTLVKGTAPTPNDTGEHLAFGEAQSGVINYRAKQPGPISGGSGQPVSKEAALGGPDSSTRGRLEKPDQPLQPGISDQGATGGLISYDRAPPPSGSAGNGNPPDSGQLAIFLVRAFLVRAILVADAKGEPAGQVKSLSGQSAPDGAFSFAGLSPGNYVVEIVDAAGKVVGTSPALSVAAGGRLSGRLGQSERGAGYSFFDVSTGAPPRQNASADKSARSTVAASDAAANPAGGFGQGMPGSPGFGPNVGGMNGPGPGMMSAPGVGPGAPAMSGPMGSMGGRAGPMTAGGAMGRP